MADARPYRDPITLATIVIAVATVAQVLTAALQWHAMQGQLAAAIHANNDSRTALIQSQRAWLLSSTMPINFTFDPTNHISNVNINPTFQNNGNSPAFRAQCWDDAQPSDINVVHNLGQSSNSEDVGNSEDIGPHQSMICPQIKLTPTQVNDLWSKRSRLFVWARVQYRDVFDDTPLHYTEICGEVTVIKDPTQAVAPGSQINLISIMVGSQRCNSAN